MDKPRDIYDLRGEVEKYTDEELEERLKELLNTGGEYSTSLGGNSSLRFGEGSPLVWETYGADLMDGGGGSPLSPAADEVPYSKKKRSKPDRFSRVPPSDLGGGDSALRSEGSNPLKGKKASRGAGSAGGDDDLSAPAPANCAPCDKKAKKQQQKEAPAQQNNSKTTTSPTNAGKKRKPTVSKEEKETPKANIARTNGEGDLDGGQTLPRVSEQGSREMMAQQIEEMKIKLQEEREVRERHEDQIRLLIARVKVLEEAASTPPNTPEPSFEGPLRKNNSRKRRRGTSKEENTRENSDEENQMRTDETTGMEVEVVKEQEQSTNAPKKSQTKRPPPVIVGGHNDWDKITEMMDKESLIPTKAKTTREGFKVFFEHFDDFEKFRMKIRESGKEQYTFQPPQERKHQIVIKGLTTTTRKEKIQEDLKNKGIEAEVLQMKSKQNDQLLPLFLVKTGNEAINQVKRLLKLDISIEPKKRTRRAVQCFRCQRWGHTQTHCEFIERCVKCAAEHPSRTCDLKPREDQSNATCCNCGGRHPASFRGCSRCPESWKPNSDRPASKREWRRTLRKP